MLSIPVDLTTQPVATLTFDVAYAPYDGQRFDGLRIDISTDCGATFSPSSYNKSGATLGTAPATQSRFAPNGPTQWRNETVNLSQYIGNRIVVKFVNINGHGNNLFVDNINILGFVGVEDGVNSTMSIFPNPNSGQFRLEVSDLPVGTSQLSVTDMTGREVFRTPIEGQGGRFETELDLRQLSSGVYYLELRSEVGRQVRKLVIE